MKLTASSSPKNRPEMPQEEMSCFPTLDVQWRVASLREVRSHHFRATLRVFFHKDKM